MAKKTGGKAEPPFPVCVFGDMHDPFTNAVIFEHLFLPFLRLLKPKIIIENGDGFDFYQISRFLKDPVRRYNMVTERDEIFIPHREQIAKAIPRDCEKYCTGSNHTDRMQKYLMRQAPELMDYEELYWADYLKLTKMGWKIADDDNEASVSMVELGNLFVLHGEFVRKQPGVAAKATLDNLGESAIINHTHKMGMSSDRFLRGRTIIAYENGCMCDIRKVSQDYVKLVAKWINMWSVVFVDEVTKLTQVEQFPVLLHKGAYHVMTPKKDGMLSVSTKAAVEVSF